MSKVVATGLLAMTLGRLPIEPMVGSNDERSNHRGRQYC
jgi:hypothetical protein